MKHPIMIPAVFVLFALPATAQIYRCEIDGVVAFSDRPCGSNHTLHAQSRGASFVTPDENLPALAEAAQAFIRERRERIAKRGRERRSAAPPAVQSPAEHVEQIYVPWPTLGHIDDRHSSKRNRRTEEDARPNNPGDDRYSPLKGPILGTRANSAAFDRRRNRDRDDRNR